MGKYRTYKVKKIIPLAIIFAILLSGITVYAKNESLIRNYKGYYSKSYLAAEKYRLGKLIDTVTLKKSAALSPQDSGSAESVPVLLYHGVITDRPDGSNVSIDSFIPQMLALKKAGYQTISIEDYYNFIYNGKKVPKKSFLLTFDDGRKDSYYPADPVLKALNYRATMFVITGSSYAKNSKFYLSPSELTTMRDSGHWDLQPHTKYGHSLYPIDQYSKGHFYSNKLWLAKQQRFETDAEYSNRVTNDLQGAKDDIMKHLGLKSYATAFPFGDIGEDQSNYPNARAVLLKQTRSIYPMAFYQFYAARGFSQNYSDTQAFLNERITVEPTWKASTLLTALSSSNAKSLPYSVTPENTNGWLQTWANSFFTNDGMVLESSSKSNGASVDLDGSYNWTNYTVKATSSLLRGSTIKTLLRAQDGNNYISCSYSSNNLQLQQVTDSKTDILANMPLNMDLTKTTQLLSTVNGQKATCTAPNGVTISAPITNPRFMKQGGIGFVISADKVNSAEGIINHVEATKIN